MQPASEETPDQFVVRLKNYLAKWLELSGSSSGDFKAIVDLIVKEQFINAFSEELAVYLLCTCSREDPRTCITSKEDVKDLQHSLDKMLDWSEECDLKMNASKCKVLHLSRNQNTRQNVYIMRDGEQLGNVAAEKDLGVYVDERLSFETHVTKSVNTANKMTGIVNRNFKLMGHEVFINLYKSLIRPHLEYASVVWCPSTIRDQKRIEGVQRRATKLVSSITDLSYPQRLQILGIPSLQYRRLRADMLQVYKIIHGIDRVEPSSFFQLVDSSRTRGHKFKIAKQRGNTSFRLHSFSNRVVDVWNALPEYVVDSPNVNIFKSRLNSIWKNHPIKFTPSFYV